MAYVVHDFNVMLPVSTLTPPWEGRYFPWYVQGQNAWGEPTRREDVGGVAPCRTMSMGTPRTSGNYLIVADQVVLPLPQGWAS